MCKFGSFYYSEKTNINVSPYKRKPPISLYSQGISIPKRSKRQAATFYSYRRLDAIDINIDCHCVGGPNYDYDYDDDDDDADDDDDGDDVVGLVRKRADNFLLSTRHDHVNYVEDWQEMK